MVKTIFNFKDKRLSIIDDAESTPGMSRQLSAFRHYIYNAMRVALEKKLGELEKAGVKEDSVQWANEVSSIFKILPNNNFEWLTATVNNGSIINTYKLTGDE